MTEDVTFIRVPPKTIEMKRYEVFEDGKPIGWVMQFMSRLNLAKETSRIRIDGKERPFWTPVYPDGRSSFRVKLETRKDAVRWLRNE